MKRITLTQGKLAPVDNRDYEWLSQYKWRARRFKSGHWYALGWVNGKQVRMHRLIMNTPKGLDVDHDDHKGLNNQRRNLKNVTRSRNLHNLADKTAGIRFYKPTGRWVVRVQKEDVRHWGGYHATFDRAVEARDRLREKLDLPQY
jgi:hypothetical protein